MIKVNENKNPSLKIIKHYIKDLSFENPQSINENNSENNSNSDFSQNINFVHTPYKNNFFSVIIKYVCKCSSKKNGNILFFLELDYFGFFKILNNSSNKTNLTKEGAKLILPYVKSIIEDITNKGGNIKITLKDVDLDLIIN